MYYYKSKRNSLKKAARCCLLFLLSANMLQAQSVNIKGIIKEAQTNRPIPAVTITAVQENLNTRSGNKGDFNMTLLLSDTVIFTHTSYQSLRIPVTALQYQTNIVLEKKSILLQEVVLNTGYQSINKERATGSFTTISNEVFNSLPSSDVISRLEGMTNALSFDRRNPYNPPQLSVRGRSTLFGDNQPLIVVDNFPFEGDLNAINPNDVQSLTFLKDAAAASIWGTRAGNGVIVITTKKGRFHQPVQVSINQFMAVSEKPDMFYSHDFLSAPAFIDWEQSLFNKGYYNSLESDPTMPPLSPAVEILIKQRDGLLTAQEASAQLNDLKNKDVRNDFKRYLYQQALTSQQAINISGGSDKINYYLAAGYDYNTSQVKGNGNNRFTVNTSTTYIPFKHLELSSAIVYTNTKEWNNGIPFNLIRTSPAKLIYPYASFTDDKGLPVPLIHDYRQSFVQSAPSMGLLPWTYSPVEELNNTDNEYHKQDIRLNIGLKYTFLPGLSAELKYQYEKAQGLRSVNYTQNSYYTRDLINQYSQIVSPGTIIRPVPLGGILDVNTDDLLAQAARAQVNYNHLWQQKHQLIAIAGAEMRETNATGFGFRNYGYDPNTLNTQVVDLTGSYPMQPSGFSDRIFSNQSLTDLLDRYLSFYANAAYTYSSRYTFSASARRDGSNLFGVNTNQKFTPLWSAGFSWRLSQERFYKWSSVPEAKLRFTYGYSGNAVNSLSAYTTAIYTSDNLSGQQRAIIQTPPNPSLRWENVATFNIGLDLESNNKRITASLDYYHKKASDLIGDIPLDPTTGFFISGRYAYRGNGAALKGDGLDIEVNTLNINKQLKWNTTFLLSWVADKVTNSPFTGTTAAYFGYGFPLQGYPLNSIYSYYWGGLNPQNGNPQILLNGKLTGNYDSVVTSAKPMDLHYNGRALPGIFGAFTNSFSFKGFTLSANILFKFNYYFRRTSISYAALANAWQGHVDFNHRWLQPGDEQFTQVPSMPASISFPGNRDQVYLMSDVLVERGDHIRLQYINLAYDFKNAKHAWFKYLQLYCNASNLGILWKANKAGLDPDYASAVSYPPVKTIAIGCKATF